MGGEVILFFIIFGTLFGIAYLYFTTRNRERMALIEKGVDASELWRKKSTRTSPIWKTLILNVSLVVIGIGAGIFVGSIMVAMGVDDDTAYPGSIFLLSGLGLFAGFIMTNRMDEKAEK
jgi:hypothetical protein